MTRSRTPVSSFGTELQAVLREGANKELRIHFESESLAIRFRARINALRAAMRREKHADSDRLYRAGVRIDPQSPKTVIIAPKDSEFRDAISDAHIPTDLPPTVSEIDIPTPKPGVETDPAESFLSTLTKATTVKKDGGESV